MDNFPTNKLIKHLKLDEGSPRYNRSFDSVFSLFTREKKEQNLKWFYANCWGNGKIQFRT